jgi:hypothetical protein
MITVNARGRRKHAFSIILLWYIFLGLVIPRYSHEKQLIENTFSWRFKLIDQWKGQLHNLVINRNYPGLKASYWFESSLLS